ncbi:MAG: PEP-CTERM sorting domain-containing protein, partial [Planctomycetes bacterium]|nr:PEP-CTERM sorting domain-containing protein [Planctomycetota bacterium]
AGQIKAATGETDLGSTIVQSTAAVPVYVNNVILEQFYGGLNTGTDTNRDQILLPLNGAGFDKYTPAFWKEGTSLDYPGNADSSNDTIWTESDGNTTLDHAGNPIATGVDALGFRATGELMIVTAGTYAFNLRADDGSKLWIDSQVVVDNDYLQGFDVNNGRSGSIYLDAGPHTFAFGFYENGGGAGFDARWDPAGGTTWAAIPADRMRYLSGVNDGVLTVEAPATLKARGVQGVNRLVVNGTLVLGEATSSTRNLVVATAGKIDLTSGNLVVDYDPAKASPFDAVVAQVQAGLGTGAWDGTHGLTSSVANGNAKGIIGIGVVENNDVDLLEGTFRTRLYDNLEVGDGVALDESSVLVKVTYWGDANLDGVIDANDYDQIDRNYLFQPAVATWSLGDFNYDGVIDANDYDKIDRAYLFQGSAMGAGVTAVAGGAVPVATPEPATLALLGLGAVAALARRRRTR